MTVLFSIIIPAYNVEPYISLCIDSIKNQSCDFECIIIDDGSTDNTLKIIKQGICNDSRFKVLTQENSGVSAARNKGISVALGEYIVCIDPDDLVSDKLLYYCEMIIKESSADMIMYDYKKITYEREFPTEVPSLTYKSIPQARALAFHNYPWSRIVRRTLFDDNLFPVGMIYEDSVTIPILIYRSSSIIKIDIPLYAYRQRENSLTLSNASINLQMFDALDELRLRCMNLNIPMVYYYTVYTHLARGALSTLGKMTMRNFPKEQIIKTRQKIWDQYQKPKTSLMLSSNANNLDKFFFLLIKTKSLGWFVFRLLFIIKSRSK